MLRHILEDCEKSFAEVVLMLSNEAASAEVYTEFKDLKFSDNIVSGDESPAVSYKSRSLECAPRDPSSVLCANVLSAAPRVVDRPSSRPGLAPFRGGARVAPETRLNACISLWLSA